VTEGLVVTLGVCLALAVPEEVALCVMLRVPEIVSAR